MSERIIDDLKEYISFILNLDPPIYVDESIKDLGKMIYQNNPQPIPYRQVFIGAIIRAKKIFFTMRCL